jgi:hypothetical protein
MYQWDELFYVILSFFGFLYAVLHVGEEKKGDKKDEKKKEAPKKDDDKKDVHFPRLKPEAIKKAMPKLTKVEGKKKK